MRPPHVHIRKLISTSSPPRSIMPSSSLPNSSQSDRHIAKLPPDIAAVA